MSYSLISNCPITFPRPFNWCNSLTLPLPSATERAYLIVKSVVRLSHPTTMDVVLRKRVCFNVYKRHSLTDKIRRKMGHTSPLTSIGVLYEIVSNIPKVSEENSWVRKVVKWIGGAAISTAASSMEAGSGSFPASS